ncbi:hypothetical protein GCM10007389_21470 [Pontibacter akesuensis]|nr:hypothetical protein GCM10007389_21470 [Pontibacter akesuensis]
MFMEVCGRINVAGNVAIMFATSFNNITNISHGNYCKTQEVKQWQAENLP